MCRIDGTQLGSRAEPTASIHALRAGRSRTQSVESAAVIASERAFEDSEEVTRAAMPGAMAHQAQRSVEIDSVDDEATDAQGTHPPELDSEASVEISGALSEGTPPRPGTVDVKSLQGSGRAAASPRIGTVDIDQLKRSRTEAVDSNQESPPAYGRGDSRQSSPPPPQDSWASPFIDSSPADRTSVIIEKPEDWLGRQLGSYKLLEVLGKGGMGCVYRAEHTKLGRPVALKVLRGDYAQRRDAVARFFQEARSVNLIRHRNIVDVTDLIELDGVTFIIMELLDGVSLSRLMRTPGAIDVTRALVLLIQICDGLAAAHSVGIVHRDLKPDNIVIVKTPDGQDLAKLLDFGVAKLLDQDPGDDDIGLKTAAGSVIGTPAYMSPEQAGGLQVDGRADIYSLGAIMYEIFTGEPLFRAKSFGEYVRKHLSEQPIAPRQTEGGAHLDGRIEQLILRCLSKSPESRFQRATDLRAELLVLLAAVETGGEYTRQLQAHTPADPSGAARPRSPGHDSGHTPMGSGPMQAMSAPADANIPDFYQVPPMSGPMPSYPDSVPQSAYPTQPTPMPGYGSGHTPMPGYGSGHTPMPTPGYGPGAPTPMPGSMNDLPRYGGPVHRGSLTPLVIGLGVLIAAAVAVAVFFALNRGGDGDRTAEASEHVPPDLSGAVPEVTELAPAPLDAGSREIRLEPLDEPAAVGAEPDQTAPTKPRPVAVRVVSTPKGAGVFAAGASRATCTTPCTLMIDPADGGSADRRDYYVRRKRYQEKKLTVDLENPPKTVNLTLDPRRRSGKTTSRTGGKQDDDGDDDGDDDEKDPPQRKAPCETPNPFAPNPC